MALIPLTHGEFRSPCEKKVVEYLQQKLPDTFAIYHNIELASHRRDRGLHVNEYDVIVVSPTGIWVLEVKPYRGRIKGNAETLWLPNKRSEKNPISLTDRKAKILKTALSVPLSELRDNLYVESLIALCHKATTDYLNDDRKGKFVHVSDIVERIIKQQRPVSDLEQQVYQDVCEFFDNRFAPLTNVNQIGAYIVDGPMDDMGEGYLTYPAHHELLKTRQRATLKIYRLDTTQPSSRINRRRELFIRDAEVITLLGEIPHDNVLRCYAPFMWEGDKVVLPLEWIDGEPLSDLLARQSSWSLAERLKIFRQIARGLEHVHNLGIIHRALSPKNVIITPEGRVKLVNFKFAKVTYSTPLGTVYQEAFNSSDWRYTAPELKQNASAATPQTDIFSAGVILFELVTGRCPFPKRVLRGQDILPRPSAVNPDLPPVIDELFSQMCQFEAQKRPVSMQEIAQKLQLVTR